MIGQYIGLSMAACQLAAIQQNAFNGLQGLQGIGQSQLCGMRNYKTEFDNSFDEMKAAFDMHLKDWDKSEDKTI